MRNSIFSDIIKIQQKERFDNAVHYVYVTIGLFYEIKDCKNLVKLNNYIRELHERLIHLNTLFLQHDYYAICEAGFDDFTQSARMRPDPLIKKLIQNPRDSDQTHSIVLNSINDYFHYWENVLVSYKSPSAYIKRIQYLIQSIVNINDYGGIYRYPDIKAILENKRQELIKNIKL